MLLRGQAIGMLLQALAGMAVKAWEVYASPWVIVGMYWLTVWSYFGLHWVPKSDAEMGAFGFGYLLFLFAAKK